MVSTIRRAVLGIALVLATSCGSDRGSRRPSSPTTTALPAVRSTDRVESSPDAVAARFLGAIEQSDRELARSLFDVRMLLWSEYPIGMMQSAYAAEAGATGESPEARIDQILRDVQARERAVDDWLAAYGPWLRAARCRPSGPAQMPAADGGSSASGAFDRWLQTVEAAGFVPLSCETPRGFPALELTVEQEIRGLLLVRYRGEASCRIAGILTDQSLGVALVMRELGSELPALGPAETPEPPIADGPIPSIGIPECDAFAARACACNNEAVRAQICSAARSGMQAWSAAIQAEPTTRPAIVQGCAAAEMSLRATCTQ